MIRRVLAAVVLVGAAAFAVLQFEGAARMVVWEMLVVLGLVSVTLGASSGRSRKVPTLFGGSAGLEGRPLRPLTSLALEIVAAVDPTLSSDRPLRQRLLRLLRHRAGLIQRPVGEEDGQRLLGADALHRLIGEGPMTLDEIEMLVDRIEAV